MPTPPPRLLAFRPMPSSAVQRKRPRSLSRSPVALRWKRPRRHYAPAAAATMVPDLPDDVLLAVFSRLPPPASIVRCAAVCRRWRRLIAGVNFFPPPPRHLGFFHHHPRSPLPQFFSNGCMGVDLGFLPVSPVCGVLVADCRGGFLLVRDLGRAHDKELSLIVCNPLSRTSLRLPSICAVGHQVDTCALLPGEGFALRVVVVLFGDDHFDVLLYSAASGSWEPSSGALRQSLKARIGPSVLVGDVVYKLLCENGIMSVNTATMQLSTVAKPDTGMSLYAGNHCIGRTDDGKLCFFVLRKPLSLMTWVLEGPNIWAAQEVVELGALLDPATVGELAGMKLSASMADQLHGCKLACISGFCEGSQVLFLAMADRIVELDLKAWRMKKLWHNTDVVYPVGDVHPYEVAWPPVLKDLGESTET